MPPKAEAKGIKEEDVNANLDPNVALANGLPWETYELGAS